MCISGKISFNPNITSFWNNYENFLSLTFNFDLSKSCHLSHHPIRPCYLPHHHHLHYIITTYLKINFWNSHHPIRNAASPWTFQGLTINFDLIRLCLFPHHPIKPYHLPHHHHLHYITTYMKINQWNPHHPITNVATSWTFQSLTINFELM